MVELKEAMKIKIEKVEKEFDVKTLLKAVKTENEQNIETVEGIKTEKIDKGAQMKKTPKAKSLDQVSSAGSAEISGQNQLQFEIEIIVNIHFG